MWRCLMQWIRRRPPELEADAEPFSYAGAMTGFIGAMIAVSVIEIGALHLLLPWRVGRIIAFALGVFGLVALLAVLAGLRMNPHSVGPAALRLRLGTTVDIPIPWTVIARVTHQFRSPDGRGVHVEELDGRRILQIAVSNQTNVAVALRHRTDVATRNGTTHSVDEVRCFADDPSALVASARPWLGAR